MELDAANVATDAAADAPTQQTPMSDTPLTGNATDPLKDLEEEKNLQETLEEPPELHADEVQTEQPVENLEQIEGQSETEMTTTDVNSRVDPQEVADPAASSSEGAIAKGALSAQPNDVAAICEGNEDDVAVAAESAVKEPVAAVEADEKDVQEQPVVDEVPANVSTKTQTNGDSNDTIEPDVVAAEVQTERQETAKDAVVDDASTDVAMSPPPEHDENEYDPSASLSVPAVPHREDEYDPANPSPTGTPVAINNQRPASEQEEYDPDHPAMNLSVAAEEPVAMEIDPVSSTTTGVENINVTPAKRKSLEDDASSSITPENGETEPKRPRYVENSKANSHEEDPKHGRHRRGSDDSTTSSSSKHKRHEEDHKGLSAAAWDRLMDFQTSGEFRVTQVSRAAFASVGAMPEFAQITIIARFVRTPMRDVRDKNGQLMRLYREYRKENPQVAALQAIDAFMSDYKSDPGLFRFGYAPPQPATGVSNVRVPYHRDQPEEETSVRNSPRQTTATNTRPEPEKRQDELSSHEASGLAPANVPSQRVVADPRLAARSQGPPVAATPRTLMGGQAEDPRRRDQSHFQSNSGTSRDPRRRGALPNQQLSSSGQPGASDIYERLPVAVKTVLNSMHREGRLREPLNDNIITRLLHLPEPVARQAVDNFSNVDLSQVGNLQGFLVGIINRVNEKAMAAEKQHRPLVPSPRGHPLSAAPRGGEYPAALQGGSVLGGPPAGRMNNNGVNGASYRDSMASGPAPALYERPYDAPQDPRDPRRRQPTQQGSSQFGGDSRGPPQTGLGRGSGAATGMTSFTVLPMSVQNQIHSLVADHTLVSLEELGSKCYEVLGQLSEPLANQVLSRFAGAPLSSVRNKGGYLIGVVKRARQEYGFNG